MQSDTEDDRHVRANRDAGLRLFQPTRESEEEVYAGRKRMAADARKWIRAGFQEVAHGDGRFLFATKRMLKTPALTHAQALAVPLRLEQKPAAIITQATSQNVK
jgi:phage terminase Nu1 subunit (DNA packaging protein)